MLGPRIGKFDPNTEPSTFAPHNVGMVCLGTLILWFGWYGFNAGSALGITGANLQVVQVVCMTTTIAAACGGLTVFCLVLLLDHIESVPLAANGILAGLVGITASTDSTNAWSALVIGVIAGCI